MHITPPVSDALWQCQRAHTAKELRARDFAEDLGEAAQNILSALRGGDDELVGRVVRAVFEAQVDRVTSHHPDTYLAGQFGVYAVDASLAVLMQAQAARVGV